jgi:hypothetical protein
MGITRLGIAIVPTMVAAIIAVQPNPSAKDFKWSTVAGFEPPRAGGQARRATDFTKSLFRFRFKGVDNAPGFLVTVEFLDATDYSDKTKRARMSIGGNPQNLKEGLPSGRDIEVCTTHAINNVVLKSGERRKSVSLYAADNICFITVSGHFSPSFQVANLEAVVENAHNEVHRLFKRVGDRIVPR